jgi:holo-[acyl-carrier protein] synthase
LVLGVGIDIVPISRIAGMLARWGGRFVARVFTAGERAYCEGRAHAAQHYAARFAAKEATLKALGVPPEAAWHDMEVLVDGGSPTMRLRGAVERAASRLGVGRTHVSLSHAGDYAVAVVVVESAG